MASSSSSHRWRYLPFAIGGVALAVGIGLALSSAPPTPPADAGRGGAANGADGESLPAPTASDSAEEPASAYEPDLSGPDVGERLAPSDAALGLATLGGSLIWLETDQATLKAVALEGAQDGGAPRVVYRSPSADAFGGAFAADDAGLYWVVEHEDHAAEPIKHLSTAAMREGHPPEELAGADSPDDLRVSGGELFWVDRGRIMRRPSTGEPRQVIKRTDRIAALAVSKGAAFWLEIPYTQRARGAHDLMRVSLDGGEPRRLARLAAVAERSQLTIAGDQLVIAEGQADGWRLAVVSTAGGGDKALAAVGPVTALSSHGETVYWAEAHERGDATTSLLRRANVGTGKVERIGRCPGAVAALFAGDGVLYWASTEGIFRLNRPSR
jgi:hypothetical protein